MGIQTYNFKSKILEKWKTYLLKNTTFIIVKAMVFESSLSLMVPVITTADLCQRYH